jgi:hypothetical protein
MTKQDSLRRAVDNAHNLIGKFRSSQLAESSLGFTSRKPCRIAMSLEWRYQSFDLAQVSIDQHGSAARAKLSWLAMQIRNERRGFYPPADARLFIGFSSRSVCIRWVLVNTALGKRPVPVSGPYQEEFESAFVQPITNGRYMNPI